MESPKSFKVAIVNGNTFGPVHATKLCSGVSAIYAASGML